MDRRDFLLLRKPRAREHSRHYVLSCEWLYYKCLDRQLQSPTDLEAAIFDVEAMRMVFDDLDTKLRDMDTVHVTQMPWLVGDIRKEFGTLLRGFKSRGGRVTFDRPQTSEESSNFK